MLEAELALPESERRVREEDEEDEKVEEAKDEGEGDTEGERTPMVIGGRTMLHLDLRGLRLLKVGSGQSRRSKLSMVRRKTRTYEAEEEWLLGLGRGVEPAISVSYCRRWCEPTPTPIFTNKEKKRRKYT